MSRQELRPTGASTPRGGFKVAALCFLAAVCEGYDLQVAGVVGPQLAPAFGLDPNQLGWVFSASIVGLMIGAALGGRLSDRFGRKRVLIGSIVVFALLTLVTPLAAGLEHLLVLRFLTGVGMGGALPNLITIAAESVKPAHRNRAVGLVYAGMPVGAALVSWLSMVGGADWRLVFLVGGVAPLALAVVLARALPRSAKPASTLTAPDLTPLPTAPEPVRPFAALFSKPNLVNSSLLWAASFTILLSTYLLINWLPSLLVRLGFGREEAVGVLLAFNVAGIAGSLGAGWMLDRARLRAFGVVGVYLAYFASILAISATPSNAAAFYLLGGLVGMTATAAVAILYALAPAVYPAEIRGTGVGLSIAVGRLGSTAGPLLAGVLLSMGRPPSDVILAMLPIIAVGAACALALASRARRAG